MDVALDVVNSASNPLCLIGPFDGCNNNCVIPSPRQKIADLRLVGHHPDVYEPSDDSFALVDALLADRNHIRGLNPTICLEVGCGSGYVIASLALILAESNPNVQYIATDISEAAVKTSSSTLIAHNVNANVVIADLVSGLEKRISGMVDVLVFNPPYIPTPPEEVGIGGITSTWAGGHRGRAVIDRILEVVDTLLSSKGRFYLVSITANNPVEICQVMRRKGFASKIVIQRATEDGSIHVLKFWRESTNDNMDSSLGQMSPLSRTSSFLQRSFSQRLSCFVPFR